ncbi:hypothetical protein [Nocardia huaxiensis]|uniref:G domain-containing protein n=1 Tax=Nocardia huaxiensis TaxID=2755382 RepID=A0A7D6ZAF6_9NOCA|nr:hypothetical protein [Nocardia huaxiensis]QLY30888.1 hypothetical protein H0264_00260 [Nocardia huaxiensis]UFS94399.1 hypothetical protein LPY97_27050 [Nocardia huaxiensis]
MPASRPLRIQITGRSKVGKTTLRNALSLLAAEETQPVDQPGCSAPVLDGDLIIYVLTGCPQPTDRQLTAALTAERTLVALNKAETIGTRWSDAAAAAARYAEILGVPVYPVVASLAARTRSGTFTTADLRTLQRHRTRNDPAFALAPELFTSPDLGPDVDDRRTLLEHWDLHGVACALTALRMDPTLTPHALLQILHCASGIDALYEELHRRYEQGPRG